MILVTHIKNSLTQLYSIFDKLDSHKNSLGELSQYAFANSLYLFNYKEIYSKFYKQDTTIFEDEEKAYVDFIFHKYLNAMNTLENIIEKSEKDIARKVIALFNYNNVDNFTLHIKKDNKKISEEINIEELIYNSPYLIKEKKYLRRLSDFNYFFYEYYSSIQDVKRLNKIMENPKVDFVVGCDNQHQLKMNMEKFNW